MDFEVQVIVSGSHLSYEFGETKKNISADYFPVEVPILMDGDDGTAVTQSMGMGFIQYPAALTKMKPDCIIVFGDRYESLTMAIAAYNLNIPIAHIQGDDETKYSLDNGYRRCIRALATFHFDVKDYGSLCCCFPIAETKVDTPCDYLVVYHPNGNLQEFKNIIEVVDKLDNVVYIQGNCDADGRKHAKLLKNVKGLVIKSVTRPEYLALLKKAKCIIGNSSSGITEAPSLNTPTVNVGNRQRGRMAADSVVNCNSSVNEIVSGIYVAETCKLYFDNPYYKPNTIKNIVTSLRTYLT